MPLIDQTHQPGLKSWVESANSSTTDFPIQNLPYGVFSRPGQSHRSIGVAIGDQVLDLRQLSQLGILETTFSDAVQSERLNELMALPKDQRVALRHAISGLLAADQVNHRDRIQGCLVNQSDVTMHLPCHIGDYSDFYASVFHATNVGSMFRPDNPLLPNYKHIPIGYHGRASSVVVSETDVRRPVGQLAPAADGNAPTRGASQQLDYELEVGCFVAQGNELGTTIPIDRAEDQLFGVTLLNDWSARDLQRWEYQPLGPFLAKSFATTISPWVVTMEALAPFRCAAFQRPASDPRPLPYLTSDSNSSTGGLSLQLEVFLQTAQMEQQQIEPIRLTHGSFENMYWTLAQMVTHHSSNGCNLRSGDLLGSGTVSGPQRESRGCLLELTWDGELDHPVPGSQRTPIELPTGESRTYLADGDTVIVRGFCHSAGLARVGFGECRGRILPAQDR